jgi:energy-coupling factor transporter transmembrane protein EcfT
MKIDSPLAQLHIVTKVVGILLLSLIVVQLMDMNNPDPAGTIVLAVFSLAALLLGGVIGWLFRSYLVVLFPMLTTLFITWLVFNPDPGTRVLAQLPIYDGTITLALSVSLAVLVICPILYFRFTRQIFWGLVIGLALAVLLARIGFNPRLVIGEVSFFHPLTLIISDKSLIVAITKVFGYATMVLISLVLVMTTRDAEVIGVLHQAKTPYSVSFFTSVMLRSLSMAVLDYGTIRQAQVARGVDLRPKSILGKILDRAQISVPLIVTMIRRSTEFGDAAMARGMTDLSSQPSTFRETRPIRVLDIILMIFFGALALLVLGFHLNLSHMLGLL